MIKMVHEDEKKDDEDESVNADGSENNDNDEVGDDYCLW